MPSAGVRKTVKLWDNGYYVDALLVLLDQGGFEYATSVIRGEVSVTLSEEDVFRLATVTLLPDMYFRIEIDDRVIDRVYYLDLVETLHSLQNPEDEV